MRNLRIKKAHDENERLLNEQAKLREKILNHEFETGGIYLILEIQGGACLRGEPTFIGSTWNNDCAFVYVKKSGLHHYFRELNGGWSRTYTDAQLIGKRIKEVQHAESTND